MSAVNVTNVTVLDNPSMFLNPFQFEISYECLLPLKDDLEWKLIYVGSAEDEKYDQVLESVLVGPVNVGNYRFVFQADPPELSKIPEEDIIGVTVLLLTCSYQGQEFIRVGYYVSNDYVEEALREEPPSKVLIEKVQRNILADKPRVTKFPIVFHAEAAAPVVHDAYAMQMGEEYAAVAPRPDEEEREEEEKNDEEEACVAAAMVTDEELASSRPSSPDLMATDDEAKPADLQTPQVFDSMQLSDGVRRGDIHTPQPLQQVC